jgi:hypothetical protein
MARDLGGGLKAYKFKIGQQATAADLIDIFAEGPALCSEALKPVRCDFQRSRPQRTWQ